jgi:DNA-directed RNA polymerase specialized sigma24 family protein
MPESIRNQESERSLLAYCLFLAQFPELREPLERWVIKQFGLTPAEAQDVVAESVERALKAIKALGGQPREIPLAEHFVDEELKVGRRMGYAIVRTAALDYLRRHQRNQTADVELSSVPCPGENLGLDRAILRQLLARLDQFYAALLDELTKKEEEFQRALVQSADRHGWGKTREGQFVFCISYLNNTGDYLDAPSHQLVSEELRASLKIEVNNCNQLAKRLKIKWMDALHPIAGGLR